KVVGKLQRGFVLVEKEWRCFPTAAMLTHMVPVNFSVLRENEDHGMPVVVEVGIPVRSLWADVGLVCLVHGGDGGVGFLRVFVFGFVVEEGDVEMVLARGVLEEAEIVVGVGAALAVPVDYESRNAHAVGLLNLLSQNRGILAGV